MTTNPLNTPWSLTFDPDGTEDYAAIRDANGEVLATSEHFWLPEPGEPVPPTLAALRVMVAGPKLLEALLTALPYVEDALDDPCFKKGTVRKDAKAIREAIAEATGELSDTASQNHNRWHRHS